MVTWFLCCSAAQRFNDVVTDRYLLQDEPDDPLDSADVIAGVNLVDQMGLVFEMYCGQQISNMTRVIRLAKQFPSLTVVLNHCGATVGPVLLDTPPLLEEWKAQIQAIALCPNVMCKGA